MASIYKLDKSWAARLSYQENGRRKRLNKAGFATKSAARAWATAQEAEIQKRGSSNLSKETVTDYFHNWFDTYKKPRLAPATQRRYEATKTVIGDFFDERSINSIDYDDYQKFINDYGSKHTIASVRKVHSQFRAAIKKAYQMGKIKFDFTEGAELSGLSGKKQAEKYLDMDDMSKLLAYTTENIHDITNVVNAMIATALLTGMRYEEVIGLTWDCVDFDAHTLQINKVWYYVDNQFGPTKNDPSNRTIKIDDQLIDVLKTWSKILDEFLLKHGYKNPHNFVFYSRFCQVVSNTDANTMLKKLYAHDHIISKKITFHGLRHTHASFLISNGISIQYVSKRLGHKNTVVTQTTYAHLFKTAQTSEENRTMDILKKLDPDEQPSPMQADIISIKKKN
ncbi:integrase [Lentilactobacillus fungorum]|uniref:Integrase n=1 Tax=Lentilactobacillus fungorum TaxID=2201250 RepID=A0ABQ3VYF9_9LACO|nr:tyrosine-type recombinase/integrase [Lentilactobacillus fungorum]GHP13031.1 integrase [Lentilactobacillus fungorum]